ncbi:hypothetical protein [Tuwongella immobilis]|uniref:DUF5666 domain-containing protein n=1 Tax=Tuwongella immobilis TaxID=692036 RepID=A0A6C2YRD4_9BACT|nr:hypothetical protein [Tuwongella immobilis]VIP03432.1 unnamed protein product [Tuwongella immobilis]VTS04236.1 unnamed protein product [Tuwongella immobilis]
MIRMLLVVVLGASMAGLGLSQEPTPKMEPKKQMKKDKADAKAKNSPTMPESESESPEEPKNLKSITGKFSKYVAKTKVLTLEVDEEETDFQLDEKTITYTTKGEPSKKFGSGIALYKAGRPVMVKLQPTEKGERVYSVTPLKK